MDVHVLCLGCGCKMSMVTRECWAAMHLTAFFTYGNKHWKCNWTCWEWRWTSRYYALTAPVFTLLIAAVLQLIFCCGTQECHSSFPFCSVPPPWVISSLVTEWCIMTGPHSAVQHNKVRYRKSPDPFLLKRKWVWAAWPCSTVVFCCKFTNEHAWREYEWYVLNLS